MDLEQIIREKDEIITMLDQRCNELLKQKDIIIQSKIEYCNREDSLMDIANKVLIAECGIMFGMLLMWVIL